MSDSSREVRTGVLVDPTTLANYLTRGLPDLSAAEIEADIRVHPRRYYIDYLKLCCSLRANFFSEDAWADYCRLGS